MKHFTFWQRWLLVAGILLVAMGAVLPAAALLGIDITYINAVFWEDGIAPVEARAFQEWIYGVYGAMAIAFGLFTCFVASNPFKARKRWGWTCLATCFTAWFVIDTFFSVRYGAYANAINNFLLFAVLMAPLLFTRREFVSSGERPAENRS